MTIKKNRKAFSLIEVSIVILIIGILIIGVIGAKHMIKKARISAAQSITRSSPISSITNNKLWLETSLAEIVLEGASANGDYITNWQDNSVNKASISTSAVGTGPTYSNSINGVQAIKFDDTSNSHYLQINNAEFLNNTDYTIFIVEKRISHNSGVKNYLLGEEGSFSFGYESETTIMQSHSQTPSADNQANIENLSSYADKPRMITITHSKAEGNKIYINATLANEDNSSEAKEHLNLTTLAIGKGYNGEIGEIVIFDRDIKLVERKEIENYLSKKWKAPNNRDNAPICTGTVLSTGCQASCSINITGSSTTTLSTGASQQISCDQAGYKGSTIQTYSCIYGTLSPIPATSQCIDDNGCDSGYINYSGVCSIVNNCTGLTIEGSSTTSINHGQISSIPCDQEGYSGFSTGYSCDNGSFTAGTNCTCDTANGYSMVGGTCVEELLLDQYSGALFALSLRKLDRDYLGNAIRVRRSSDNSEQDIGFVSGALDESALLSFVGAGNGFIVKIYDQSGNGNDAIQPATANQPRIVISGAIIKTNGKPTIDFGLSTDDWFLYFPNGLFNGATSLAQFFVMQLNASVGNGGIFATDTPSSNGYQIIQSATVNQEGRFNMNGVSYNSNTNDAYNMWNVNLQSLTSVIANSSSTQAYKNNTAVTMTRTTAMPTLTSVTRYAIGKYYNTSGFLSGKIQEFVAYDTDQASNRNAISTNINDFYSIY